MTPMQACQWLTPGVSPSWVQATCNEPQDTHVAGMRTLLAVNSLLYFVIFKLFSLLYYDAQPFYLPANF